MVYAPSLIIIGYYFEKYRALATGIAVCGSGFGVVIFSRGLATFVEHYGWKWTFRLEAGLVSLTCLISFLFAEVKPTLVEFNLNDDIDYEPIPIERAQLGSPSLAISHHEFSTSIKP